MKNKILLALKGALMGAANVIPGVSGGTMALLTGIFEPLIHAVKSFDLTALKLVTSGQFKKAAAHVNLGFLIPVGIGIAASILSLARLLEYLFEYYAVYVWSFFFGLILASVYFVGKRIRRFSAPVLLLFIAGTVTAASIAFIEPATENSSLPYLLLCGAIAMCSMILPGLSGSYVLLLMGNYQLVMIDAVNTLNLAVLLPVAIGAGLGLLLFARFLSWVFSRFHDQTIALLTGFIFGSLSVLWPWKSAITESFGEKIKVTGYTYSIPEFSGGTVIAVLILLAGIIAIIAVETVAGHRTEEE
jgi:putative membrane protein